MNESLALSRALGDDEGAAWTLLDLGQHAYGCVERVAALRADGASAARLLGAAQGVREALGVSVDPVDRDEYSEIVAGVRAQLDEATLARAWAEGRAPGEADWDKLMAVALAD